MRKSICILSFSPISSDARVLRQIKYLSPFYDITIIGYGPPHPAYEDSPGISWIRLDRQDQIPSLTTALKARTFRGIRFFARVANKLQQARNKLLSLSGIVLPLASEAWYWKQPQYEEAWRHASANRYDAYHGNDWDALPIAAQAARKNHSALVMDLHEYAPLEYEELPLWWIKKRFITYILKKYSPWADASITVASPIAERYRDEFGFYPTVIMNAPENIPGLHHKTESSSVRLIHHGGASRLRHPELMIKTIAQCDERYSLHFMFIHNEYVEKLKRTAEAVAPERVFFHDPVPPELITQTISRFDVGFYMLPPTNYNNLVALPNKFFDFICAGLPVCIGPSPSMAGLVENYGFGVVCPSFSPSHMASLLNRTTKEEWAAMRMAAGKAAIGINARTEMKKLVQIYEHVLSR